MTKKRTKVITATWIAQQESAYDALIEFIVDFLAVRDRDESELSPGLFRIWMICRLESDVVNGGFWQFMSNALSSHDESDRYLRPTLSAVNELGLNELKPLVAETIQIYDSLVKSQSRPDASMESVFDEMYERFSALDYSWHEKLERYIRDHPDEFVYPSRSPLGK